MARQRRGGGFRAPELRGTLGTLLRTTLAQAGTLRDALERGAREGRSRLDAALATSRQSRERDAALAELGEIVLELIRQGEIDLAELPEARTIVAHLDELDADAAHEDDHDEELAPAPVQNRFGGSRTSRRRPDDDDGTVSAKTWSPPMAAGKPRRSQSQPRVWRPPVDDEHEGAPVDADEIASGTRSRDRQTKVTARERPPERDRPAVRQRSIPRRPDDEITARERPPTAPRKGGISFEEDDEDLADYMHPEDVPPKAPPDGDA